MRTIVWILVAACSCLAGCTTTYRVHVNTYSELGESFDRASPIYIVVDPNSQNPILRRQIAAKIHGLLEGEGYNPVDKVEAAAYTLTFETGINSERVLDYAPMQTPFGGYYGGFHGRGFGWGMGYTTYVPYIDTVYTHWLRMRLYATKDMEQKQAEGGEPPQPSNHQTVWLGEAIVGTDSPELREAVNYLLAACVEYLGIDTREWVTVAIKADDPRIVDLSAD